MGLTKAYDGGDHDEDHVNPGTRQLVRAPGQEALDHEQYHCLQYQLDDARGSEESILTVRMGSKVRYTMLALTSILNFINRAHRCQELGMRLSTTKAHRGNAETRTPGYTEQMIHISEEDDHSPI